MENRLDHPLVSVVTPVLNGIKYLEACVQSLLNQSYSNIEHIFTDGGSTDGTLEMLTLYRAKYPDRIKFISEPDKGIGDAWAKGLRIANGEIIGWLGSDDTYGPDTIQTVVRFFEANPDAYFVFGGCNNINEKGEIIKQVIPKDFNLNEAINDACSIPWPSVFCKREVIEKISPDIIPKQGGELEYWILIGKKFKIHRIEDVLSSFRVYDNKIRDNNDLYSFARAAFVVGRRHGAGAFSPCARRYYLALVTRPLQPVIDPIFHFMSTGDANRGNFLVRVTRPLHPAIAAIYHFMVGSKKPKRNRN